MAKLLSPIEAMNKNLETPNSENIDFSLFKYNGTSTKSIYYCKKHKSKFEMTPSNFWVGHGCSLCGKENSIQKHIGKKVVHKVRKSHEQIIKEFKNVHGRVKYNYDNVVYERNNKKVQIRCIEHGIFYQTPNKHLLGRGCPICANRIRNINNKWTLSDFIKAAKKNHKNKYDYSLSIYSGALSFVNINCREHGIFKQKAIDHLNGHGCKKCGIELNRVKLFKSNEEVISKAKIVHNEYYNYDKVKYTGVYEKIIIICPIHGEFKQIANGHLRGAGCPKCNKSKGEKLISELLEKRNIKYNEQYKFHDCRNKAPLPFDFYLSELNLCVEFQGEQHYRVMEHWGGKSAYERVVINDRIKKEYCENKSIRLLEIPHNLNAVEIEKLLFTFIKD